LIPQIEETPLIEPVAAAAPVGSAGNRESWFGETVKMVERVGKSHL